MPPLPETRRLRPDVPVDLRRTLRLIGHGSLDPTTRVRDGEARLGLRTPEGPAQLSLKASGNEIEATAWGDGPAVAWALEHAPGIAGCDDHAEGFAPADRRLKELWHRFNGARIPRTTLVAQALMSVVLGQRVTTDDAARAYRALVHRWGERAPGPAGAGGDGAAGQQRSVWVPPDPAFVAQQAYFAFHPFGVERNRAEVVRGVARSAGRLDALAAPDVDPAEARRRMQALPGVGAWSAASAALFALGDPDAVPVGDLHLKHLMCWALAGERWGTDERMLELLEPYPGHRGRVCLLVIFSGARRPATRPVRDPTYGRPVSPSSRRRSG
jgi:3-methyladenine DNA glycosylase/8-oxoguanine DNA glycosylase